MAGHTADMFMPLKDVAAELTDTFKEWGEP